VSGPFRSSRSTRACERTPGVHHLPSSPDTRLVVTNLLVCDDVEASTRFYGDVLGATVVRSGGPGPTIVKLANAWIVLVEGGGPTPDKPTVTLAPAAEPDLVDSFLNLRVADIDAVYREWTARGAVFLAEPIDNQGLEIRCYLSDPGGHLIEVGQAL
jgi:catechol 2,3-dioxygenase-like lactoylglutathione lyase family enzyme